MRVWLFKDQVLLLSKLDSLIPIKPIPVWFPVLAYFPTVESASKFLELFLHHFASLLMTHSLTQFFDWDY